MLAKKASTSANEQLRRSIRQKNPVVWFGYNEYMVHHYAYMMRVAEVCEPKSYVEAAKDSNWRAAMEEEMRTLVENETWDPVDAQKGVKPIGCRWVYKVKHNIDDSVNRYKAQLVAKGYAQHLHGIDYDETFMPERNRSRNKLHLIHRCRLGRKRRRPPIHIRIRSLSWERRDRVE